MRNKNTLQVVILIVALAIPGVALAKDPDVLLQEAIVNFRMGQFRKSIKLLKRARRKAKDDKLKAQIQLYLGMTYGVRKKWKLARRAFKSALKLDPLQEVTDEVAKKSVVKLYWEVRQKLKGRLRVGIPGRKVEVLLDGKAVGAAPYDAKIPVGKHRLLLKSADGLYLKEVEVVVWYGKEVQIKGPLEFRGGRLSVSSVPPGARVLLDGKEAGTTPIKALEIVAGEHELKLELAGHDTHTTKLNLLAGKTLSKEINLATVAPAPVPGPAPASQPEKTPLVPEEPAPAGRKWPVWTMVTAGLAVAAGGVALGVGLTYKSAISEYEADGLKPARWQELRDEIPQLETITNVSFAVAGAAVVATALVYFFVDRPAMKAEGPSIAPTPGGAVFTWQF